MKHMHVIDEQKEPSTWVVGSYLYLGLCVLGILSICAFECDLSLHKASEPLLYIYPLFGMFFLVKGAGNASWRNGRYALLEEGVFCKYTLSREQIPWARIRSGGVFPVHTVADRGTKYYIVLFRTQDRPKFPRRIDYCCMDKQEMVLIRATEERAAQVKTALEAHQIPWLGQQEYKFAH